METKNFEKMMNKFKKNSTDRLRDHKDKQFHGKKEMMKQRRAQRRRTQKW